MTTEPAEHRCKADPRYTLLACLLLLPHVVFAQTDISVTELLFEPVPLPAEGAVPTLPLVGFAAAVASLDSAAIRYSGLDEAERRTAQTELARYLARIGESDSGVVANPQELSQDLMNTGLLYQRLNDHENALRMLERAANAAGSDGLDQVALREAMAASFHARGDNDAADEMMSMALALQRSQYGDNSAELAPALLKLGAWNTQAFLERSSISRNINHMTPTQMMVDPRNLFNVAGTGPESTPLYKLYEARQNYLAALKPLLDAQNFTHPALIPLERGLLTNYFLHTHQENIVYEPDFYLTRKKEKTASRLNQNSIEISTSEGYDTGRESHQRILSYIYSDEDALYRELATAMLAEADWDLLYQHKPEAEDRYHATYEFFHQNADLVTELQDLLHPPLPVVLPTFLPAPNSRARLDIPADAEVAYFGYIDVSFNLTKWGKTRRVRVLGTGGEVTDTMELRLKQYLANIQFRPRFNGTEVDTGELRLRYYIGI